MLFGSLHYQAQQRRVAKHACRLQPLVRDGSVPRPRSGYRLRDVLTHIELDRGDKLGEDIADQRLLLIGQPMVGRARQLLGSRHQLGARGARPIRSRCEQSFDVPVAIVRHKSSSGPR
ncbi:MAG: hypothetical protein Q7J32_08890 [Sphingomonadaceae bacterium]|nr:hypothetical protein [Sphingomonadaceae bacterium]